MNTLVGHSGEVWSLIIKDGKVVSGSDDSTIMIWNMSDGKVVATLSGHQGAVSGLASFEGTDRIVSSSYDNTLKIWDCKRLKLLDTLNGHSNLVTGVACSKEFIVSGSMDRTVQLWTWDGERRQVFVGHKDSVNCVAIAGCVVVSGSTDETINVWDANTGTHRCSLLGHASKINTVAIEGNYVLSGSSDKTIKVWALDECDTLPTVKSLRYVQSQSLSICGAIGASSSLDGGIEIFDVKTGFVTPTKGPLAATREVLSIAIKGNYIFAGDKNNEVSCWEIGSGKLWKQWCAHSDWIRCLAVLGNYLVSGSDDTLVKVWLLDDPSNSCFHTFKSHDREVMCVAMEGSIIVSGSLDKTVKVWSLQNMSILSTFRHAATLRTVAISNGVVSSTDADGFAKLWDIQKKSEVEFMEFTSQESSCVSSSTRLIYIDDGTRVSASGIQVGFTLDSTLRTYCAEGNVLIIAEWNGCIHTLKATYNTSCV